MKTFYNGPSAKPYLSLALTAILFLSGLSRLGAQSTASSANGSPALILSFSGAVSRNNIVLYWTMENQTNNKYFVIERSGNGNNFDSIDVVTGLNNSQQTDYTYTDLSSLNGDNYYRLRQVDKDGNVKYSKVLRLINTNKKIAANTKLQVFPNPAGDIVHYALTSAATGQVTVQVYNLAGVMVMSRQQQLSAGLNQQSLAISTLKEGNYLLKIINREGNNQYIQSFVKLM